MKFCSANVENLRNFYTTQVQTLLSAERQIVAALPDLIKEASDQRLRLAMEEHLHETRNHGARLEEILNDCHGSAVAVHSTVMAAMLEEAMFVVCSVTDSLVRDAALICTAQQIEHWEIAAYGAMRHFARILGETEQAQLLDQTLREEGHADGVLSELAGQMNASRRFAA